MTCVMSVNLMMQGEKSNDAIFSKSVLFSKAHELRGSGLSDPMGREAIALLDFGRSVFFFRFFYRRYTLLSFGGRAPALCWRLSHSPT